MPFRIARAYPQILPPAGQTAPARNTPAAVISRLFEGFSPSLMLRWVILCSFFATRVSHARHQIPAPGLGTPWDLGFTRRLCLCVHGGLSRVLPANRASTQATAKAIRAPPPGKPGTPLDASRLDPRSRSRIHRCGGDAADFRDLSAHRSGSDRSEFGRAQVVGPASCGNRRIHTPADSHGLWGQPDWPGRDHG